MKSLVVLTSLMVSLVLISTTEWLLNATKTYPYAGFNNYTFSLSQREESASDVASSESINNDNIVEENNEEKEPFKYATNYSDSSQNDNNVSGERLKLDVGAKPISGLGYDIELNDNIEKYSAELIISGEEKTVEEELIEDEFPYYLKLNRTHNVINVYKKDKNGEYTIPYKAIVCCTGTATPKAGSKYQLPNYRREWNGLRGGVYGQYAVQITGNILFHSVPYTKKNKSCLEYWEYDKMGTKCSMGCIRLTVEGAKWIYENVPAGSWVEFYEDDEPGPFGKPETLKISNNTACRGWDPTDDVPENPWKNPELASVGMDEIKNASGVLGVENIIIDEENDSGEEIINLLNYPETEEQIIILNKELANMYGVEFDDNFTVESGEIIGDGDYPGYM